MANFAAPGFSAGFARASNAMAEKERNEIAREQLGQATQKQAQERYKGAFDTALDAAEAHFEPQLERLSEGIQSGASEEQIAALTQNAMMGPESYALFAAEQRATAAAEARRSGFSEEQVEQLLQVMPSPGEYMQRKQAQLESTLELAQLQANRPDGATGFFANVTDMGDVRVTQERGADNSLTFKVGDQEVDPRDISPSVQRTQEVQDLQIPGHTPAQSGQILGELRKSAGANMAFAQIANTVIQNTAGKPETVGLTGAVLRGLDVITSQAEAIQNVTGLDTRYEKAVEEYDFRDMAGESQEVKTRLLDLVFLNLAAKGQTGRAVSDRDLEIFMEATGFGTGSPNLIASGLKSAVDNNEMALRASIINQTANSIPLDAIAPEGFGRIQSGNNPADLLRQAQEALDRGDVDEAMRLMDQAGN